MASSLPVGALVSDERTISLEYGYAADEEYIPDNSRDNNMESNEIVESVDYEWTKYLSSTAAMSLGESGLRSSLYGRVAVSSILSPVPFNVRTS